jgi:hypothetical protein
LIVLTRQYIRRRMQLKAVWVKHSQSNIREEMR